MKFLFFLLLPVFALADEQSRLIAARDLAHGHSIHDQVLVGNALAELQTLACSGDSAASALLGWKYYSGKDEFKKDDSKAEPYLAYAAEHGDGEAAVRLVLLNNAKVPAAAAFVEAYKWLRVATYIEGAGSASVQIAGNSLQLLLSHYPEFQLHQADAETQAALIIHRLRNRLNASLTPPCQITR